MRLYSWPEKWGYGLILIHSSLDLMNIDLTKYHNLVNKCQLS